MELSAYADDARQVDENHSLKSRTFHRHRNHFRTDSFAVFHTVQHSQFNLSIMLFINIDST